MKKLLSIFFLLTFAVMAFGQTKNTAPIKFKTEPKTFTEAEEAFREFDPDKLSINANNLTEKDIEDLRVNFFEEVKPYLIDKGEYTERLARLAKPIFLFHQSGKSRTAVFKHHRPTVFTWKETFISFSTGAMDLLTDHEIAALIAHEIGHLYFVEALAKARAEKNDRRARVIELKCDLVALTTLSKLNIQPSDLISAVKKLIKERSRLQIGSFETGSPSLQSREEIYALYISGKK